MSAVYVILGILTFVAGILTTSQIRSDIQVQIVVTLLVGGIIMGGIGTVLSRLRQIARAVGADRPPAPKRDPYA